MPRRLMALALLVALTGCLEGEPEAELTSSDAAIGDGPTSPESVPGLEPSTPPLQGEPATEETDEGAVEVRPVTPEELNQLVAESDGKAVLFDFWATWCIPCITQFPHTVALSEKYPQDLVVYAVSMNESDELADVQEFYGKHGLGNVQPLISADGGSDEAYLGFEITGGALPHYKVFGRDGKLVATFGGDVDEPIESEKIDAAVAEAVEE